MWLRGIFLMRSHPSYLRRGLTLCLIPVHSHPHTTPLQVNTARKNNRPATWQEGAYPTKKAMILRCKNPGRIFENFGEALLIPRVGQHFLQVTCVILWRK